MYLWWLVLACTKISVFLFNIKLLLKLSWLAYFKCHGWFYEKEALINILITPACKTCCEPLFSPPLSGSWSCRCWHISLCVFPGVSLLVPHGAVAENMSWEMHMVINQGEARWGQSLPKYHFEHLSACQSPTIISSILVGSPPSVLTLLIPANYLPSSGSFIMAAELNKTSVVSLPHSTEISEFVKSLQMSPAKAKAAKIVRTLNQ